LGAIVCLIEARCNEIQPQPTRGQPEWRDARPRSAGTRRFSVINAQLCRRRLLYIIKAFYMRVNDDGQTVAAMDVLAPGIGEIIGGSQREERLEVLDARMAESDIDREHYTPTLPSHPGNARY
jgi:hypothetical protein